MPNKCTVEYRTHPNELVAVPACLLTPYHLCQLYDNYLDIVNKNQDQGEEVKCKPLVPDMSDIDLAFLSRLLISGSCMGVLIHIAKVSFRIRPSIEAE